MMLDIQVEVFWVVTPL